LRKSNIAARLGTNDDPSYVLVFQLSSEKLKMINDNIAIQEVSHEESFL